MKILDCEQGSPEWFAARLGIPTATDFKSIITAEKGNLSAGADGLINRLIDETVRSELQEQTFTGNKHTEHGKQWEGRARAWYGFITGSTIKEVGFCLRDDGRAGCSPDALAYGFDGPQIDMWGLEIKCPDGPTHVGYLRAKTLPSEYKQQVHGSMVITGLRCWYFVSYCPGYEPMLLRVDWDEYTDKAAAALEQFLDRLDIAKKEMGL